MMRTTEVARRLQVSRKTLRAISARELPYRQLKANGWRAYDERDVERYVESRTVRE